MKRLCILMTIAMLTTATAGCSCCKQWFCSWHKPTCDVCTTGSPIASHGVTYSEPGVVPYSESEVIPYGGPAEYSNGKILPTPDLGPIDTES